MDCIIPGPSIKPFCAAIGCLSRVGKELYIDFDPIDGLSLRALNDAKSVFGNFHYEPGFFSKCGSIPLSRKEKKRKRKHNDDDDDERWTVRLAMKALGAVVRQRKDVLNLRIVTMGDHLAFEFQIQKMGTATIVRVIHKLGYSPAQGVTAVTATEGTSEIVAQPSVLMTMLEPLKRSMEIALIVNDTHRLISSVTFAHDDLPDEATSSLSKGQASLKTETSVTFDDLIDVHYVSHPDMDQNKNKQPGIPPPDDLKEQVVLVYTLKEFKAFLQYCSQAFTDQELQVTIQFFWGGKPLVIKTMAENFNAEFVMATLDHQLLKNIKPTSTAVPADA